MAMGVTFDDKAPMIGGGEGISGRTAGRMETGMASGQAGLASGRGAQESALAAYQQQLTGQGPSVAREQLRAGADRNMAQQMQMAAQSRGGNLAAAGRQAMAGGAAGMMQANQQAAQLQAQEQQAAMQGIAGIGGQMAGQGLQQEMGYMNAYTGLESQAAQMAMDQQQFNKEMTFNKNQALTANLFKGAEMVGSMASGGVGGSDPDMKQNIRPGDDIGDRVASLGSPSAYEYRPGAGPPGEKVSHMAPQYEQGFPGLVVDTPAGQMVDTHGLAAASMASNADQEQRLRAIESQTPELRGVLGEDWGTVDPRMLAEGGLRASPEEREARARSRMEAERELGMMDRMEQDVRRNPFRHQKTLGTLDNREAPTWEGYRPQEQSEMHGYGPSASDSDVWWESRRGRDADGMGEGQSGLMRKAYADNTTQAFERGEITSDEYARSLQADKERQYGPVRSALARLAPQQERQRFVGRDRLPEMEEEPRESWRDRFDDWKARRAERRG